MLNGKLQLERVANGWILTQPDSPPEVFVEAFDCICRISEILGVESGAATARMLLDMAEGFTSSGHIDSATDPDVAELAAPNTPSTVAIGD